jgi:hypothetical protein
MRKLFIGVITIITVGAVSTVLAQSFFGFGGNEGPNNGQPSLAPSPTNGQLSADQFQSIVKSKAQQTQSDQKQQLQQILSTPAPYTPPQTNVSPLPNQPAGAATMPSAPAAATPTAVPNTAVQPAATAPVNSYATPEPATQDFGISNPAPSSPQSQVYTGFGPGNQNSAPSNNTNSPASSSGWNIKY